MKTLLLLVIVMSAAGCSHSSAPKKGELQELAFRRSAAEFVVKVETAVEIEKSVPSADHCFEVAKELDSFTSEMPGDGVSSKLNDVKNYMRMAIQAVRQRGKYLNIANEYATMDKIEESARSTEKADESIQDIASSINFIRESIAIK